MVTTKIKTNKEAATQQLQEATEQLTAQREQAIRDPKAPRSDAPQGTTHPTPPGGSEGIP